MTKHLDHARLMDVVRTYGAGPLTPEKRKALLACYIEDAAIGERVDDLERDVSRLKGQASLMKNGGSDASST